MQKVNNDNLQTETLLSSDLLPRTCNRVDYGFVKKTQVFCPSGDKFLNVYTCGCEPGLHRQQTQRSWDIIAIPVQSQTLTTRSTRNTDVSLTHVNPGMSLRTVTTTYYQHRRSNIYSPKLLIIIMVYGILTPFILNK